MDRSPHSRPQATALHDRLVSCLWWLIFLGGAAGGTTAGVVLALWLVLPTPTGLLLIVACWLVGNAIGWSLAARLDAALARKEANKDRPRYAAGSTGITRYTPHQRREAVAYLPASDTRTARGVPVQQRVLECP